VRSPGSAKHRGSRFDRSPPSRPSPNETRRKSSNPGWPGVIVLGTGRSIRGGIAPSAHLAAFDDVLTRVESTPDAAVTAPGGRLDFAKSDAMIRAIMRRDLDNHGSCARPSAFSSRFLRCTRPARHRPADHSLHGPAR